ncbi:hypothetical protein [Breoghania sp.]|uniref:hypothetical protein n=1 Tax=Breoghania sp. TaxID=2065378 RepID=UPI002623A828|nr:hypothetical protein [Breoghania sp.]MDJ0930337.1 hypothetical protein [Breoghania sp.]
MATASETKMSPEGKSVFLGGGASMDSETDGLLSLLRVATWVYDPHKNTITWQRIFAETPGEIRPQSTERLSDVVSRYREEERSNLLRHYESALRDGHHGPVRFTVMNRVGIPTHIESAAIRAETKSGAPVVRGVCSATARTRRMSGAKWRSRTL